MKAKDLRERTPEDLKELEKSLQKDTFTARFKNFTNRLDDTSAIKKNKRDLARVKTILREQARTAAGEGTAAAAAPKPAKKPAKKTAAKAAPKKAASATKKPTKKSEAK